MDLGGEMLYNQKKQIVKLPIDIEDVATVTECWTYNRLAIIKTSPYYRDWIASHYDLYTTNEYNFYFGNTWLYPPSYYEEILQRKQIRLYSFTRDNVVAELKEALSNGYYIIMTVKPWKDENYFHEVLFFGYDDNDQQFVVVGLEHHGFQTKMFSYEHMKDTIEEIQAYFMNREREGIGLALSYQYPVTALKLNPGFVPDNCVFEAYYKVKREIEGEFQDEHSMCGLAQYAWNLYRYKGISCLDAFRQMLEKEIVGEGFVEWFRGISNAAKKLLEHRLMMTCSMNYVLEKWEFAITEEARVSVANYSKSNESVEKWLNLCMKYEFTQDKELLRRIIMEIPKQFSIEKQSLETFVKKGINWEAFNGKYL